MSLVPGGVGPQARAVLGLVPCATLCNWQRLIAAGQQQAGYSDEAKLHRLDTCAVAEVCGVGCGRSEAACTAVRIYALALRCTASARVARGALLAGQACK